MAIYHLTAKMVSRETGRSAVAAAAYRAAEKLEDRTHEMTHDYTGKGGVEFSEILAPAGAPVWVYEREELWNAVEEVEVRKDAQLAREVEVALPIELNHEEQVGLLRDFVQKEFVSRGMVADMAIHRDNPDNPHAHILLSTRVLEEEGFGRKERSWNDRALLMRWRESWAGLANEHLARAGHAVQIDHRSLAEQGSQLQPGRKLGIGVERQKDEKLPEYLAERLAEQRKIARENGERILGDPNVALKALTHQHATFTHHDIARFLHTRTDGAEQFQAAYLKVTTSKELVTLGADDANRPRFTTREMIELEKGMLERSERMAGRSSHVVRERFQRQVLADSRLSEEQKKAFVHVTGQSDLSVVVGVAGAGKSTLLDGARRAWEAEGLNVRGGALSGIAAENLENSSGIRSRTLASWEMSWAGGRDALTSRDVLVIDEAGMVGTRQLARVLERAEQAGAKVVLVGDPEQLQAIEAGAPFRGIAAEVGVTELKQVHRQKLSWQREATAALATGRTGDAVSTYEREKRVRAADTRSEARQAMLAAWSKAGKLKASESRLMLAYTRDDVAALNSEARELRKSAGEIKGGQTIDTSRGKREFAVGDRMYFLRNDRGLGVKNGSLGTVEKIKDGVLQVKLDGEESRRVVVDSKFYPHLEHGYAATVHKAQGTTVDRTYVLATPHFDRHATYVALSRHRESAAVFYGREDFKGGTAMEAAQNMKAVLSRARPKELAHDYLDVAPIPSRSDRSSVAQKSTLTEQFEARRAEKSRELDARSGRSRSTDQSPDADSRRSSSLLDVYREQIERSRIAALRYWQERQAEREADARASAHRSGQHGADASHAPSKAKERGKQLDKDQEYSR